VSLHVPGCHGVAQVRRRADQIRESLEKPEMCVVRNARQEIGEHRGQQADNRINAKGTSDHSGSTANRLGNGRSVAQAQPYSSEIR
jgi:hypothetical protein